MKAGADMLDCFNFDRSRNCLARLPKDDRQTLRGCWARPNVNPQAVLPNRRILLRTV